MVKPSHVAVCVHRSLKRHPLLSTLAQLMVEQNGCPVGSGLRRGDVQDFSSETSLTLTNVSFSLWANCRDLLPPASFFCRMRRPPPPPPRKRGRRQRRRRHPGAGAGEAGTIAVAIAFPAPARQAWGRPACAWCVCENGGSLPALESHATQGRKRRTTHAAGASGTREAPSVHRGEEEEEAQSKPGSGRLQAGRRSSRLQCLLAKASAAGAAAARRMLRPHGRRGDSRRSKQAPDLRWLLVSRRARVCASGSAPRRRRVCTPTSCGRWPGGPPVPLPLAASGLRLVPREENALCWLVTSFQQVAGSAASACAASAPLAGL